MWLFWSLMLTQDTTHLFSIYLPCKFKVRSFGCRPAPPMTCKYLAEPTPVPPPLL